MIGKLSRVGSIRVEVIRWGRWGRNNNSVQRGAQAGRWPSWRIGYAENAVPQEIGRAHRPGYPLIPEWLRGQVPR